MNILSLVGVATVLFLVYRIGLFVFQSFIYKSSSVKKFLNKQSWAVVTGATAGIGEGFTYELIKRGVNVLAISRSQSKLDDLSKSVTTKYASTGATVETLVVDFANENPVDYAKKIRDAVANKKVTVLVNNVGVNNKDNKPFYFLDQEEADFDSLVSVNINAPLYVTKAVMPRMVENKGGVVLNLSSYTAKYPVGMNAVYSATKSFVDSWSQALTAEYASKGIRVLSLLPMYVRSNMTQIRKTSLTVCDGQKLASDALNSVDAPLLSSSFSPYFAHRAMIAVLGLLPEKVLSSVALKTMIGVRKKMDARAQRQSASEVKKE